MHFPTFMRMSMCYAHDAHAHVGAGVSIGSTRQTSTPSRMCGVATQGGHRTSRMVTTSRASMTVTAGFGRAARLWHANGVPNIRQYMRMQCSRANHIEQLWLAGRKCQSNATSIEDAAGMPRVGSPASLGPSAERQEAPGTEVMASCPYHKRRRPYQKHREQ